MVNLIGWDLENETIMKENVPVTVFIRRCCTTSKILIKFTL